MPDNKAVRQTKCFEKTQPVERKYSSMICFDLQCNLLLLKQQKFEGWFGNIFEFFSVDKKFMIAKFTHNTILSFLSLPSGRYWFQENTKSFCHLCKIKQFSQYLTLHTVRPKQQRFNLIKQWSDLRLTCACKI